MFYDIFFLYLPNVFETEFQTCPLDLFTDAFYPQRASEINHRLVAIANGAAPALLRTTWERERVRRTCVVGLDWSYALADLLEIAEVSLFFFCAPFFPQGALMQEEGEEEKEGEIRKRVCAREK